MNEVKVSVIIPTYKRSDYLERAIKSVLNQTYTNLEVIVVDDNGIGTKSQIETENSIIKFKDDDRFTYLKHEINRNGSAARNTGFRYSSGKYIMFLDDDDYLLPSKIELHVEMHTKTSLDVGASYSLFKRELHNKLFDESTDNFGGDLTYEILSNSIHIQAGSNLFVRRDIVEKVGGYDESFKRRQDIEFALKISKITQFKCVNSIELVATLDDRSNVISLQENESNIRYYFTMFDSYIESFEASRQKKIYQSQYLQLWRTAVLNHEWTFAKKVRKQYKIPYFTVVRYFLYSISRRFKKKNYGFKI